MIALELTYRKKEEMHRFTNVLDELDLIMPMCSQICYKNFFLIHLFDAAKVAHFQSIDTCLLMFAASVFL